jgi:hypothetical protein
MDNIKPYIINFVYSKYFLIVCVLALSLFWQLAGANAKYYPLECSNQYSGYCNEDSDCYTQFGDDGLNYGGFCFYAPNNPIEFQDETTGLEHISDQLEMVLSGSTFEWNLIGFWLPFGVILNFCMTAVFFLLFKFGYFRKT